MGHFLHFGVGKNILHEPWQNLDASHDIRKPLRFDDNSATAIMLEHVIEHVPYKQGIAFFTEALRVLEPAGVLRISFPDVSRLIGRLYNFKMPKQDPELVFSPEAKRYAEALEQRSLPGSTPSDLTTRAAIAMLLSGWGHEMAWTRETVGACLLTTGYSAVHVRAYQEGLYGYCDGHHQEVGLDIAMAETTALEATK